MTLHDTVHGFVVEREVSLPELDAVMYQMKHEKTGLELVWISREEENKVFGIGFETLPWNDTGVFHILEHSVLCGSKNYPVKEPFVELLKNSMNTFLNAMTFPDKTFYPVASRNDKDFVNLMRVYLDAVFYPAVYTKPEIFYQEGWHYEFDSEGKPGYKGVVFNEMKGAFADADELMDMTYDFAESMGMKPYYLYRQKNMSGNFENVGFAREGAEGLYNILIMEEKQTILAAGANAQTKIVYNSPPRVDRIENVKSVDDYIRRTDEMIERKRCYFNGKSKQQAD